MEANEFSIQARISTQTLHAWLDAGWLRPLRDEEATHYSEIDLARAHLINDLKNLDVNDEAMPVILDLIDQVHGLRRLLREVLSATKEQ
jgi:chaperone modulatory protein CbpM